MPWQQHVLDVALEVLPDNRFAYREVNLTVPRQSGKTILLLALMVHRCVMAQRMKRWDDAKGTEVPWGRQRVTYTAQDRNAARKKLERDFADILRNSRSFSEVSMPRHRPTSVTAWKQSLNNGSEHLLFGRGNYLQIDAPTNTAVHGDTLDLGVIDEAFARTDDAVEQAMMPATQTRWNPQLWVVSTAGTKSSPYLYRKVLSGREACEAGVSDSVAYFEWSIPDGADIADEDVWWDSHPALGHTLEVDFLRSMLERARRDPEKGEDAFRRPYGNQWVSIPVLSAAATPQVIPFEVFMARHDPNSEPLEPITFGVAASDDRQWACVSYAGRRADGQHHVEVFKHAAGVAWVVDTIREIRRQRPNAVFAVQPGSAAGSLIEELEAAKVKLEKVSGQAFGGYCGAFIDAFNGPSPSAFHREGPSNASRFRTALKSARLRPAGTVRVWACDPNADITALVSATLAFGVLPTATAAPMSLSFVL